MRNLLGCACRRTVERENRDEGGSEAASGKDSHAEMHIGGEQSDGRYDLVP